MTSPTEPQRTTKATHPDLPPGLVLGPDGKPCKVCNSWQDWAKIKVVKKGASSSAKSDPLAMMAAMAGGAAAVKTKADDKEADRTDCPPDTAELGRATWTFLHTTAAYYPTEPSAEHQSRMRALLSSLPTLYACAPCADDFGEDIKANPPTLVGGTDLVGGCVSGTTR